MSDDEAKVETRPAKHATWLCRLRIAVCVFFGLLTVALMMMWVRSYWWADALWYRPSERVAFRAMSDKGAILFHSVPGVRDMGDPPPIGWSRRQYWYANYQSNAAGLSRWRRALPGFYSHVRFQPQAPYWAIALLTSAVATALWTHSRLAFSIRTLLIATTLAALALGLLVWMVR